tara:strand:- start:1552 stop:1875 length:324 start_codon:yes stop_codon:yes gene_type:complete
MRHLFPILLALAIVPFTTLNAQEVRIEGRISEVRSFGGSEGFFLKNPDPVLLADDVVIEDQDGSSLSVAALSDLVFNNKDRVGIVATIRDDEHIEQIAVLGIDATPP